MVSLLVVTDVDKDVMVVEVLTGELFSLFVTVFFVVVQVVRIIISGKYKISEHACKTRNLFIILLLFFIFFYIKTIAAPYAFSYSY